MLVFEKHWTFWRNLKYANVSAVQWAASDRRQLGRLAGCRSIRVPGPAAVFSRSASPPRHAAAKGGACAASPGALVSEHRFIVADPICNHKTGLSRPQAKCNRQKKKN